MYNKIPIYGPEIIWYEDVEKEREVIRKTYFKGELNGKYYGDLEKKLTNEYERSAFYTYQLYEAIIVVKKEDIITDNRHLYKIHKPIKISDGFLPESFYIKIIDDINEEHYKVKIHNAEISYPNFNQKLTQVDGNEIFGTLSAEITFHIEDTIIEKYTEKEKRSKREIIGWWPPDEPGNTCIQDTLTGKREFKTEEHKEYVRFEYYNDDCSTYWGDWQFKQCIEGAFTGLYETKTELYKNYVRYQFYKADCTTYWGNWEKLGCTKDAPTGRTETKDGWWLKRYIRYEYYNDDCTTYWGKWQFKEKIEVEYDPDFFSKLLLWLLFICLIGFAIYKIGIVSFIVLLILGALYLLLNNQFSLLTNIFRWGLRLISIVFAIGLITAFISYFKHGFKQEIFPKRNDYSNTNSENERTSNDTTNKLIINHREWKDYTNKSYTADLKIRYFDYYDSKRFNNTMLNATDFRSVYNSLLANDENKLNLICREFDSLRIKNNYENNSKELADMIVTCVQDIPYFLILNGSCSIYDNRDKTIQQLLASGCGCKGYVPNGVQSPVEFMADLKGDCDTRSLLLYLILKKFGYKTLLLVSEYYKHAIIAVNLSNNNSGITINYNGDKYSVWETTANGVPSGVLSPDVDNMNLWTIYLN
jgi:hypothetical protein